MITAVDSSVLLGVLVAGSAHGERSYTALENGRNAGRLVVCPVVWAEVRAVFNCDWKIFKPKSVSIVGESVSAEIEKSEDIKLPDGRTNHRVTVLVKISKDAPIGYVRRILNFTAEVGNGTEPPFEQTASARVNLNVVGVKHLLK